MSSSRESTAGTPKRRRPRAAVACDSCRTRKVKCDGQFPCASCIQAPFQCSYKVRHSAASIDDGSHGQPTPTDRRRHNASTGQTPSISARPPTANSNLFTPQLHDSSQFQPIRPHHPHESDTRTILTSPHSIDGPQTESTTTMPPSLGSEPPIHVHTPDDEPEEGLGDINQHTDGAEFYGRTGTFYFLSRLQSRAKGQKEQRPELATTSRHRSSFHQPRDTIRSDESVVNLLHSSDYPVSTAQNARVISQSQASQSPQQPLLPDTAGSASFSAPSPGGAVRGSAARTELERQCARLYFTNLHCIHPILDQQAFLNRCEKEVWAKDVVTAPPETLTPGATGARSRSRFLSLFNIVLAIGAITAEDTALVMWEGAAEFLDQAFRQDGKCDNESTYIPIKASQVFFETAKFHLEDTFESCSFETAQTLFLMSVFCQNALKPHSCYMYAGMAIRTAFAIGIPTSLHSETSLESRFWWGLYSFEFEMCSSAGRLSFLQKPSHYRIVLPRLSQSSPGPSTYLINCMVDLAEILMDISANAARLDEPETLLQRSSRAFVLDQRLSAWRSQLPNPFDLDRSSLDEAELITKQKIVLQLRYLNARILLHRTFLISASVESHKEQYAAHTTACVEAASATIRFVHATYLHRPYFRTWWYNCTYVLDATMVLLYVILSNINPLTAAGLIEDIEKSLEIFSSMRRLAVARRCTEITKEVLAIARSHRDGNNGRDAQGMAEMSGADGVFNDVSLLNCLGPLRNAIGAGSGSGPGQGVDTEMYQADPFAGLVDASLVFDFLNFEDWAAWTDLGAGVIQNEVANNHPSH